MNEFLDAYKRLEKLCNELYNQQHGISLYIADMEATSTGASRMVPNWHSDLDTLKHLRHIRNAMVHDLSEQEVSYTQKDVRCLKEFYQRIMTQQDPLALLQQKQNSHRPKKKMRDAKETYLRDVRVFNNASANSPEDRLSIKQGLIISLVVLVVILLTVGILLARDNGWI